MATWHKVETIGRVAITDPSSEKIWPMSGFSTVEVLLIPNGGRSKSGKPATMLPVKMKVGFVAFRKKNNSTFVSLNL